MTSKECRHCKQPIHPDARICHHCKSNQSWVGNQRDPRFVLLMLGVLIAIFVPLLIWLPNAMITTHGTLPTPTLKVTESTLRYTKSDAGTRLFVVGTAENSSHTDATRIWFRVRLLNEEGDIIDTLLDGESGLVVPARTSRTFRVTGLVSVKPEDVKKAEVVVERSSERNKFD